MKQDGLVIVNPDLYGSWSEHKGEKIALFDFSTYKLHVGTVRIRAVNCGKATCDKCPHRIYAYARFRDGGKVREKYLGVAR